MKKNINVTEAIFPMPVLMIATYNEDNTIDVMNAAWGTMLDRDKVMLNLTETHKTVQNIKKREPLPSVLLMLPMLKKQITLELSLAITHPINLKIVG